MSRNEIVSTNSLNQQILYTQSLVKGLLKRIGNISSNADSLTFTVPNSILGSNSTKNSDGSYQTVVSQLQNEQIPDQEITTIKILGLDNSIQNILTQLNNLKITPNSTYNSYDINDPNGNPQPKAITILEDIVNGLSTLWDAYKFTMQAYQYLTGIRNAIGSNNRAYAQLIDEVDNAVEDIATNTENIATQATEFTALETQVEALEVQIQTETGRVTVLEAKETALEVRTGVTETGLAANDAHDVVQDGLIEAQTAAIAASEAAQAAALATAVGGLEAEISAVAAGAALGAALAGIFGLAKGTGSNGETTYTINNPAFDPTTINNNIVALQTDNMANKTFLNAMIANNYITFSGGIYTLTDSFKNLASNLMASMSSILDIYTKFVNAGFLTATTNNGITTYSPTMAFTNLLTVVSTNSNSISDIYSKLVGNGFLTSTTNNGVTTYTITTVGQQISSWVPQIANALVTANILTVSTNGPTITYAFNSAFTSGGASQTSVNNINSALVSAGIFSASTDGNGNTTYSYNSNFFNTDRSFYYGYIANSYSSNLAVGDHFKFETSSFINGSSITLDKTSAYSTTTNAASVGRILLKANKTYKIACNTGNILFNSNCTAIAIQWFNSDTNTAIGLPAFPSSATTTTTRYGSQICSVLIKPTSDTRIELRILSAFPGDSSGNIQILADNTYGYMCFIAEELSPNVIDTGATNAANIAALQSDNTTNKANIATNTSNIATNASNIATNASNISINTTNITALQNIEKLEANIFAQTGLATPTYDTNGNPTNYTVSNFAKNLVTNYYYGIGLTLYGSDYLPPYHEQIYAYWQARNTRTIQTTGAVFPDGNTTGKALQNNSFMANWYQTKGYSGNLLTSGSGSNLPRLLNDGNSGPSTGSPTAYEVYTGNGGLLSSNLKLNDYSIGVSGGYTMWVLFRSFVTNTGLGSTGCAIMGVDSGSSGIGLYMNQFGIYSGVGSGAFYAVKSAATNIGANATPVITNQQYYFITLTYGINDANSVQYYNYSGPSPGNVTASVAGTMSAGSGFKVAITINGKLCGQSSSNGPSINSSVFGLGCQSNTSNNFTTNNALVSFVAAGIHQIDMSAGAPLSNMFAWIKNQHPNITFVDPY